MKQMGVKASLGALAALLMLMIPQAVSAQGLDFSITVGGVATGDVGEVIDVATHTVAADAVGATCTVVGSTENNSSVHAGNDLSLSSGDDAITVADVEGVPGATINGSTELTLGETVVITLTLGPDGVTSGGLTLNFSCAQPQPTTSTTQVPAGAVDAGFGGLAQGGESPALTLTGFGALLMAVAATVVVAALVRRQDVRRG